MKPHELTRTMLHWFVRPELEAYALQHPDCTCEELCAAVSREIQTRYCCSSMVEELLKTVERQAGIVHCLLCCCRVKGQGVSMPPKLPTKGDFIPKTTKKKAARKRVSTGKKKPDSKQGRT